MPKNTTQCPQPGLEPGPLARESSALTMRPPRLPVGLHVITLIWFSIPFLRFMVEPIPCPNVTKGDNLLPPFRTPKPKQYENSSKWYLNISWHSLPGKSSCHRIFMEALTMSMAKILHVLNNTYITYSIILEVLAPRSKGCRGDKDLCYYEKAFEILKAGFH